MMKNKSKSSILSKTSIVIFLFAFLIVFLCFIYGDIQYTSVHTLNFVRAITQGNPLGLYSYNYGVIINGNWTCVCYDLPIYFIFMAWNSVLYVIYNFFKFDIAHNFFSLIWIKSMLIAFLIACCVAIKKICMTFDMSKDKIKLAIFLFISSPLVFSSLYFMSQYDIIPLFFILMGTYNYIIKKDKQFILWFAFAIPLKLFAIFPFVPLLLLRNKSLKEIIPKSVLVMIPLFLSKFIQMFMPLYKASVTSFTDSMLNKLINSANINIGMSSISIFLLCYILICFYAYKNDKQSDFKYKTIYVTFATYAILFLTIKAHPYWYIYLTPFLSIIFMLNTKHFKLNLILEIIMCSSIILLQINLYNHCFRNIMINDMLFSVTTNIRINNYESIRSIFNYINLAKYSSIFMTIYFVSTIVILYLNQSQKTSNSTFRINNWLINIRTLLFIPVAIILLLICLL